MHSNFTKPSSSTSSYLLSPDYKYSIMIILIACSLVSGIIPSQLPTTISPEVQSLAQLSRKVPPPPKPHLPATHNQVKQIAVIAIGQEKIQPTAIPVIPTIAPSGSQSWGVARQIDEHTWTMNVGVDSAMASPQEIFVALNAYRQKKGKQTLSWDNTLADYANSRAQIFANLQKTDAHAGFIDLIKNQDGFSKLGFNSLGENSSYGYTLQGVHLIEWVYAGDKPHDDNQLSDAWSHVGIGVQKTATDLVFGGNKR